jgi:ATPase subunit of ABC transporter with duplicated ATPase domains
MSLITIAGVAKSHAAQHLFSGVDLQIAAGRRVAIVGPNGAGKTTLLELITGEQEVDAGTITRARDTVIGYLPQEAPDATLDQLLHDALGEAGRTLKALRNPQDLDAYAHALDRAEATGAWAAESRAEEVRRRLTIDHLDPARPLRRLSGGEQAQERRLAGAVGADEAGSVAGVQGQRQPFEEGRAVIAFRQVECA